MLAMRRTAKVKGRIIFLMVSIKTIKDINAMGVPDGVICAKKDLKLFVMANVNLSNQITIVRVKFKDICEVIDITWGNKEKKLQINTKIKIETGTLESIRCFIFFISFTIFFLFPKENWISKVFVIKDNTEYLTFIIFIFSIFFAIMIIIDTINVNKKGFIWANDTSNIEKRFVNISIIFILL